MNTPSKNSTTTADYKGLKALVSLPKPIELIFSFFFSFKKFYLWSIAVVAHCVIQITVFIGILNLTDYEASNNRIIDFLGIPGGKLVLCIVAFLGIRICFELILVVLGIHSKLSTIAESLEKIEKNMK